MLVKSVRCFPGISDFSSVEFLANFSSIQTTAISDSSPACQMSAVYSPENSQLLHSSLAEICSLKPSCICRVCSREQSDMSNTDLLTELRWAFGNYADGSVLFLSLPLPVPFRHELHHGEVLVSLSLDDSVCCPALEVSVFLGPDWVPSALTQVAVFSLKATFRSRSSSSCPPGQSSWHQSLKGYQFTLQFILKEIFEYFLKGWAFLVSYRIGWNLILLHVLNN